MVSQGTPGSLEQSNDVIIQNLVVPPNLLTTQHNSTDPINLNLQSHEVEMPGCAPKTSTGMVLENRSNNEVVNNAASSVTACQIPTKPSHGSQAFEESVVNIEQMNGKVNKVLYYID